MGLISMGSCPFCESGRNTPCFATYTDGYHCYTCGKHKHGNSDEYIFRPGLIEKSITIPSFTTNVNKFSPKVLQWLYKYFVFENLIKKYNIGYVPGDSHTEESLVFGFYDKSLFWQQRFFPSKKFKTGGSKDQLFIIKNSDSRSIVIVEDFISAIRVGEHSDTLCLWGTSISPNSMTFLAKSRKNIIIWLDPDQAGENASKTMKKKLSNESIKQSTHRAFAVRKPQTITILQAEKQPKEYCDNELKQLLEEHYENI